MLGGLALPLAGLPLSAVAAENSGPAASPPAIPPVTGNPPDLANLHAPLAWLAGVRGPALSFLDSRWRDLETWKREARPVFHRQLSYAPPAEPLGATLVSREERAAFTVETVRIRATAAYDIPARVLLPRGRRGPLPAVIAMHDHSGRYVWAHEKVLSAASDSEALAAFRADAYDGAWAEALAARGFVVLVSDAFYFGARRLRVEELDPARAAGDVRAAIQTARTARPGSSEWMAAIDRTCGQYEHLTAKTIFAAGATWPGLLVWDDMRTVDYLLTRPEVDPARVGCAGLSLGGLRTAHLIAADPRIKAACVTGWMTEFAAQLRNHLRHHTWMAYVPGLYPALDLPDAAALHAPGALLVQQCSQDRLYPMSGLQGAIAKLARLYAKAGIPERFRGTFHDVPHCFRAPLQAEAFAWFERWLA
ncbi:hypothetical protein DB354_03810 [Opitutus sp. ER46]|nr:hypothetical protein DB354_03810 [Opitutus sp. ER46]